MFIKTKIFGDVEISDDKILTFEDGIIGFPDLKHFTLIHDEEKGKDAGIRYFQSIEEPAFAMPVMNPLMVCEDYNPQVSEEF
ncbi:MAG: flagellar assembly protein FliW, partial [Clostridiales bacterium]|nr:flagellar assembly protein FliW [Clostridiales bacterium]